MRRILIGISKSLLLAVLILLVLSTSILPVLGSSRVNGSFGAISFSESFYPDLWRIEVSSSWTMYIHGPHPSTIDGRENGYAQFEAPPGGSGKIKARGPISHSSIHGPLRYPFSISGSLTTKRGRIRNDTLSFHPNVIWTAPEWVPTAGLVPVRIEFSDGAQKTQRFFQSTSWDGYSVRSRATWRLKGKKRERWQVFIQGWDRWSHEVTTDVGAGVNVHWAVSAIIEIENGRWKSGRAQVGILGAEPVSSPESRYSVNYRTWTPPAYQVSGSVHGREVFLPLWNDPYSTYALRYNFTNNGHRVEEVETPLVPSTGMHILPLANTTLFGEGGDVITIRRLR